VVFRLPKYNSIDDISIKVGNDNAVFLKAECGAAPQKICVETRYEWTAERQRISDKYPDFDKWVKDPNYNSWY